MSKIKLADAIHVEARPSRVIGTGDMGAVVAPADLPAVYSNLHAKVYATGEGFLFKNLLPMAYSSDGKKTLSNRLIGLRWSYLRNAYRKSAKSCFAAEKLDNGYWVTDNFSHNYYHWFCMVLPKLFLLSKVDRNANILLPQYLSGYDFVEQSIVALGFSNMTFIPKGNALKVQNLRTIDPIGPTRIMRQDLFGEMRKPFNQKYATRSTKPPAGRTYISRGSATKRRVTNESEILEVLKAYDFQISKMEDLDFRAQVKLMQNSKYLVSPHGAGLTNIMFMKSGGSVLEFRNAVNPQCIISLASALDHKHYSIMAHPSSVNRSAHWDDMKIDPQTLDDALKTMTSAR